jgi:hypothetical protein
MGTETETIDSSLILIKQGAEAVSYNHFFYLLNQLAVAHTQYYIKIQFLLVFIDAPALYKSVILIPGY